MTALWILLATASAQQEVCDHPTTHAEWAAQLDAADLALSQGDLPGARSELKAAHRGVLCMEQLVRPSYIARMARQLSMAFFFDQDEDAQRRWGYASWFADPSLPWPSDVGPEHPLRAIVDPDDAPAMGQPESGLALAPPAKGAYFFNGRPLLQASAPVEIPAFVQVTDKKGLIVARFWQDGTAFPEAYLGPPRQLKLPKFYTPPSPDARAVIQDPLFGPPPDDAIASTPAPQVPPPVTRQPTAAIPPATPTGLPSLIDPFTEAKLRAISRERSERSDTVDGVARTISTEVTTFVQDLGEAGPVLAKDFADWLAYRPEFTHDRAIAAGVADRHYLQGWKGDAPPKPNAPVRWVSFTVARAYCDDWGGGLAPADLADPAPTLPEWRIQAGQPAQRQPDGRVTPFSDDLATCQDVGLRCNQ